MPPSDNHTITDLLAEVRLGNSKAASRLIEAVYGELKRLAAYHMRAERRNHTLQTTALVNEACMRLLGPKAIAYQDRAHFMAVAAQQMRRVLVDHARGVRAQKRGDPGARIRLEDAHTVMSPQGAELPELDSLLDQLAKLDPRAAKAVELKFFGGFTDKEAAGVMGISLPALRRDWEFAKTWLYSKMSR